MKDGLTFNVRGQADGPVRNKAGEAGKAASSSINVVYMGGQAFLRLANPGECGAIAKGSVVEAVADARQFKDQIYPGEATITRIDGKVTSAGTVLGVK